MYLFWVIYNGTKNCDIASKLEGRLRLQLDLNDKKFQN